jgi:hypothetical protein
MKQRRWFEHIHEEGDRLPPMAGVMAGWSEGARWWQFSIVLVAGAHLFRLGFDPNMTDVL